MIRQQKTCREAYIAAPAGYERRKKKREQQYKEQEVKKYTKDDLAHSVLALAIKLGYCY
jgi:hypothetical protein